MRNQDQEQQASKKICDQCKRTDVEELEINEGGYYFKGTVCGKHAAEWHAHFETLMKNKRS